MTKRPLPPLPPLQVERDSKEHLWRCVYCSDPVDFPDKPCMKPKCVKARRDAERRMGISRCTCSSSMAPGKECAIHGEAL